MISSTPNFTGSAQAISFSRILFAEPEAIYSAWTNPARLGKWMASRAENDLQIGGAYRYEIPGPSGIFYIHYGNFQILEPGRLLRQTFAIESTEENPFAGEFIEIRLARLGPHRTELTFTNGWALPMIEDEDLAGVEANWQAWIDQLEKYLASLPAPGALATAPASVHILRNFSATPEEVFDAWINPAKVARWLFTSGQAEGVSARVALDVRVGGQWSISETRDGTDTRAEGHYLVVNSPHHLAFTFRMPQFSPLEDEITVDLYRSGEFSLLNFTHSGPDISEELAQLPPGGVSASEVGWHQMFEGLERVTSLASGVSLR